MTAHVVEVFGEGDIVDVRSFVHSKYASDDLDRANMHAVYSAYTRSEVMRLMSHSLHALCKHPASTFSLLTRQIESSAAALLEMRNQIDNVNAHNIFFNNHRNAHELRFLGNYLTLHVAHLSQALAWIINSVHDDHVVHFAHAQESIGGINTGLVVVSCYD
jgi:hypothetical protein